TNYLYLRYLARTNDASLGIQPKTSTDPGNPNSWVASGFENVATRPATGMTNHVEREIRIPMDGVNRRFLKLDITK
ncbi:MAG: hypothetical protein RLZZ112_1067, partial [Verrucomicrobiota bacterium]